MDLCNIYKIEELENLGVDIKELKRGKTIQYSDKVFVRGSSVHNKFKEVALEEYSKYIEAGLDSFIVQSPSYVTVWKENKEQSKSEPNVKTENNLISIVPEKEAKNTTHLEVQEKNEETVGSPEKKKDESQVSPNEQTSQNIQEESSGTGLLGSNWW